MVKTANSPLSATLLTAISVLVATGAFPSAHALQVATASSPTSSPASGGNSESKASTPVILPLVVHDKKGALVSNLQKGDLAITQDGRSQTIQSLTKVEASQPLHVGLLVDTSHGMLGALDPERK